MIKIDNTNTSQVCMIIRPGKSFEPFWQQILRHDFLLPMCEYQVGEVTKFFVKQPKFSVVVIVVAAKICLSVSS